MKTVRVISIICNTLLTVALVLIILFAGSYLLLQGLGYSPMAVLSGSMLPSYSVGDLVFINKNVTPEEINEGDVISYRINEDTVVTHRVVTVEDGYFITKGDANNIEDSNPVPYDILIGRAWFRIPKLGQQIADFSSIKGIAYGAIVLSILFALFITPVVLNSLMKSSGAADSKEATQKGGDDSEK